MTVPWIAVRKNGRWIVRIFDVERVEITEEDLKASNTDTKGEV